MSQNDQEFEELTIGSITGLQAFLRNAQHQYNTGLERESEVVAEGDFDYGDSLHSAFQTMRSTVTELIAAIQQGQSVSTGDAARLQRQYDTFVAIVEGEVKNSRNVGKSEKKSESGEKSLVQKKNHSKEKSSQATSQKLKPRTGSLKIATDDTVVDATDRVSVSERSREVQTTEESGKQKKKRRKKKKKKSAEESSSEMQNHAQKIRPILHQSREKLHVLKSDYPKPNMVQAMLFEEVQEGIEHLEILTKKPRLQKEQLVSVSEVASHISRALQAIAEAAEDEIVAQPDSDTVPIVTEQAAETLEVADKSIGKNEQPAVSFVPSSIANATPKVVKRPVPASLKPLPKPDSIHEQESLTAMYLTKPQQKMFINEYYSSARGFERIVDATITKIEAETIDGIDKWLGDVSASAFSFIKDMTVNDMISFADRPYESVAADLQKENIKYETFAAWRDLVDEMLQLIPDGEKMLFGQLFVEWMFVLASGDTE